MAFIHSQWRTETTTGAPLYPVVRSRSTSAWTLHSPPSATAKNWRLPLAPSDGPDGDLLSAQARGCRNAPPHAAGLAKV